MTTPRSFIILSAERAGDPHNVERTAALRTLLSLFQPSLDFDEVEGCYNGVTEAAFRVWTPENDYVAAVRAEEFLHDMAQIFDQESVLHVVYSTRSKDMHAYLRFLDNRDGPIIQRIGTWQPLTGAQPDSYSIINGQTYVVV